MADVTGLEPVAPKREGSSPSDSTLIRQFDEQNRQLLPATCRFDSCPDQFQVIRRYVSKVAMRMAADHETWVRIPHVPPFPPATLESFEPNVMGSCTNIPRQSTCSSSLSVRTKEPAAVFPRGLAWVRRATSPTLLKRRSASRGGSRLNRTYLSALCHMA